MAKVANRRESVRYVSSKSGGEIPWQFSEEGYVIAPDRVEQRPFARHIKEK